jgi:hypothetical protein
MYMVELVGIEKLGTLKTDKLLIRRESYNAQKASKTCNARFIVRLLYGDFVSQSKCLFETKQIATRLFVI